MFNKTLRKVMALFAAILSVIAGFAIFTASAQEISEHVEVMHFDIAEDGTRFVFAEDPVFEDGMPDYGNSFVTRGYIYPEGTLYGREHSTSDHRWYRRLC